MHFAIIIVMLVLSLIWPKATKAFIVAPIIGLVLGGLGWSIIAIMNSSFNTFNFFLVCFGVMTLLAEIIVHWDDIKSME
jgi:hypothetical protein